MFKQLREKPLAALTTRGQDNVYYLKDIKSSAPNSDNFSQPGLKLLTKALPLTGKRLAILSVGNQSSPISTLSSKALVVTTLGKEK